MMFGNTNIVKILLEILDDKSVRSAVYIGVGRNGDNPKNLSRAAAPLITYSHAKRHSVISARNLLAILKFQIIFVMEQINTGLRINFKLNLTVTFLPTNK